MLRDLLTLRQEQVIDLSAEGLDRRQVAAYLDLAEETVKVHAHNAFLRLGARNMAHAVGMVLMDDLRAHVVNAYQEGIRRERRRRIGAACREQTLRAVDRW